MLPDSTPTRRHTAPSKAIIFIIFLVSVIIIFIFRLSQVAYIGILECCIAFSLVSLLYLLIRKKKNKEQYLIHHTKPASILFAIIVGVTALIVIVIGQGGLMPKKPKLRLAAYEASFKVINTHTAGEYTRIVFNGFPKLEGTTPIQRKNYLETYYDHYRKALMLEPRGHHDMFGAYVTEPINKAADYAVFFMDTGGYLNMCGHGTIGTATALIESGMVSVKKPYTELILEAPAGLVYTKAEVKGGKVSAVTFQNVPAFLYKQDLKIVIDNIEITYDISFGGSFFALVDIEALGWQIDPRYLSALEEFGMKLLAKVNADVPVRHPTLNITTVDLVEFYTHSSTPGCDFRNVVVFGNHQADRSPCGTGTTAKIAALHAKNSWPVGKPCVSESIIGSTFTGVIKEETKVGDFDAVVVHITGSAFVIGEETCLINSDDPLKYGFTI